MASALPSSRPQALLALPIVRAFVAVVTTTPSADFCCTVRAPYDVLSHASVTHSRSPEISSTAFDTRPPDLPPVPLMDMGFAVTCQLARHRRPPHPVLVHRPVSLLHASFRPHLAVTPLRFTTLHLHQVGTGLSPVAAEHARRTNKRPRFHAACWNFLDTTGVRLSYFGGSAGLGVAGFGVALPVPGFGVAGFAVPAAGGAGTPDCTL